MDMESFEWTSAVLAFQYSTAGRWTLGDANTAPTGEHKLIVGKASDNLAYKLDYDSVADDITPGLGSATNETIVFETGDHRLSGDVQNQSIAYRMHVIYVAQDNITATVSASNNGGVTFNTGQAYSLTGAVGDDLRYKVLDIVPIEGRRVRFKLSIAPSSGAAVTEVPEMWIEAQPTSENA